MEDLNWELLTECQAMGDGGAVRNSMAAFLQWFAADFQRNVEAMQGRLRQYRYGGGGVPPSNARAGRQSSSRMVGLSQIRRGRGGHSCS